MTAEALPEPEEFLDEELPEEVVTEPAEILSVAHWAMNRLREIEAEERVVKDKADADTARIRAWHEREKSRLDGRRAAVTEFLRRHHDVYYALDPRHHKTVDTPSGRFGRRKAQDEWVVDADVFVGWALDNRADLLRIEPAKVAIKAALSPLVPTDKLLPGDVVEAQVDGEVVPGVEVMRKPDTFFVSPTVMGTEKIALDLDATITAAVNARVEAEVMRALSGDETIGRLVTAALSQTVEVPKPGSSYDKERVPFLTAVLRKTIQEATEAAVRKLVVEEVESVEEAVRKALRRDLAKIAHVLTESLVNAAGKPYGFTIDVGLRMPVS